MCVCVQIKIVPYKSTTVAAQRYEQKLKEQSKTKVFLALPDVYLYRGPFEEYF